MGNIEFWIIETIETLSLGKPKANNTID